MTNTETRYIHWDMGVYGPFADEAEAKAYQRTHRMIGSSIDTEAGAE